MTTSRMYSTEQEMATFEEVVNKNTASNSETPHSLVTDIERILYIGIGGTGGRALLKTKERYLGIFGFIPNSVKFIHIDTDEPQKITGAFFDLQFDEHELVPINVVNPMAVVNNVNSIAEFWPKGVLADPIVDGCGQRRTNGRLALHFRSFEVFNTIRTVIEELQSPHLKSSHPGKYQIPPSNTVRICLVGSDCGGTGSGMAVDIARYIREVLFNGNPGNQLLGFFIAHTAFEQKPHTDLIDSNAYAFWKEIDYLASADPRKIPKVSIHDAVLPGEDRKGVGSLMPFNKIMILEPKNDIYAYRLEDIEDSLSRILFLVSGYLTGNAISIWRNTAALPWFGKQPLISGVGESEIVFRASEINRFAISGMVKKITDQILMQDDSIEVSKVDVLNHLNSWQLIEANKDQLIDRILDPQAGSNIHVPVKYDAKTAEQFLSAELNNRSKLFELIRKTGHSKADEARRKALDDLRSHIHSTSNRPGGLLYIEQFLRQCHAFLSSYRDMMIEEISEFECIKEKRLKSIENMRLQLKEAAGKIFNRSKNIKKAYENLAFETKSYQVAEAEIIRRNFAITIYTELIKEVDQLKARGKALQKSCELASDAAITEMQAVISRRRHKRPNEIEIGDELADHAIHLSDVSGYLKKFSASPSFLDLSQRNADELFGEFRRYCMTLPLARALNKENLDTILRQLSEDKLKDLVSDMDRFSLPLWQWDMSYRNFNEGRKTENIFLIGCGSTDDNIFTRFNLLQFLPSKGNAKPAIVGTGDHNRIVCIRLEDSIPPFALKSLAATKNKYDRAKRESISMRDRQFNRIAYEIDGRLEDILPDLFPSREKEEDIQVWTLAHVPEVFDLISRTGSYYYAFSPKHGRPADDYKIRLAQGRVAAFHKYMKDEDLIHEHQQLINQRSKKMGDSELAAKLREYVDGELMQQARVISETELKQLVEKEIYTINAFINQLSSF